MLDIRVRSENDEQFRKVMEALRPLGVDVVTSEDDPLVAALFYVARMNSKLDNLGQLTHLKKIVQCMNMLEDAAEQQKIYYNRLNQERRYAEMRKIELYKRMKNAFDDVKGIVYPSSSELVFLTEKEIVRLFHPYLTTEALQKYYIQEYNNARDS